MMEALRGLFGSKKFLGAIVGVIVALGARYGLNLDPEIVALIVGLFAAAIIGQGVADHGKEAAKINAAAPANDNTSNVGAVVNVAPPAPSSPLGGIDKVAAVVLFVGITSTLVVGGVSACGNTKDALRAGGRAFVDCMKPATKSAAGELGEAFENTVRNLLDSTGKIDRAGLREVAAPLKSDAPRCALDAAIAAVLNPPPPRPGAPASAPLEVDAADVSSAYAELRAEAWGGVEIRK